MKHIQLHFISENTFHCIITCSPELLFFLRIQAKRTFNSTLKVYLHTTQQEQLSVLGATVGQRHLETVEVERDGEVRLGVEGGASF